MAENECESSSMWSLRFDVVVIDEAAQALEVDSPVKQEGCILGLHLRHLRHLRAASQGCVRIARIDAEPPSPCRTIMLDYSGRQ